MKTQTPYALADAVIGLGDIRRGDLGVAARVMEALEQECPANGPEIAFVGENLAALPGLLHGRKAAVIVTPAGLTGWPGIVTSLDAPDFFALAAPRAGTLCRLAALAEKLAWIECAMGLPPRLGVVLLETAHEQGAYLSRSARSGLRRAVAAVWRYLATSESPGPANCRVSRLYRFSLPEMTA
ncbi:MAG TPA: hypothetical protein PKC79_07700 [Solidesulfovibrio magneticus]|jgi:Ni,Fe-hydrogenase maturation factor|nr:hypothetical protein [Solidesulfovibrio magneticus]